MNAIRQKIAAVVRAIEPFDELEQTHQADVLDWIASGTPLFRVRKPDDPSKHLVSYFVLYDEQAGKLLLIDHIKAKAWLPTGGHVEIDEDPRTTVMREAEEELQIAAAFDTPFGDKPQFVTVTQTRGEGSHIDVSLWYVIRGDSTLTLAYDAAEMNGYQWVSLPGILAMDIATLDPHMHRFVRKLLRHFTETQSS